MTKTGEEEGGPSRQGSDSGADPAAAVQSLQKCRLHGLLVEVEQAEVEDAGGECFPRTPLFSFHWTH